MMTLKALSVTVFILFSLVQGDSNTSKIDNDELIKRAEEDINNDVKEMMKMGARSKRFVHKKITPM